MRKLYLLLGDPVAHSRSPAIHARAFALLGIDAVYAPCRVSAPDLEPAIDGIRALGIDGFNVTVPHKTAAAQLVDRLHESAAHVGAVSCVVRDGDALVGHNTDAPGLLRALAAKRIDASGGAVIVGAGGSARAAAFALGRAARTVTIVNRTLDAARSLARSVESAGAHAHAAPLQSEEARRAFQEAAVVVHCTTVGLHSEAMAFDATLLPPRAALVDLVYAGSTGETPLVRAARERGLTAIDGIDVLVQQAIASLEIWLSTSSLGHLAPALREAALA
jgi:shikimate dehydrogenase